jgi:acyl-CoA dehydrogenase
MHLYLTLMNGYRWRHGFAAAEGVLRRIAVEGIVLMTSGGSDGLWPTGTAIRENEGFRISGRKQFCSQAPIADVLVTTARYDDPDAGPSILMVSIPTKAAGVEIVETWDAMGMRATGSHDVVLTDVFVADGQVTARRPYGRLDPVMRGALIHFCPTVASVYFGIAAGARDEAIRVIGRKAIAGGPAAADPLIQRSVGLIDRKLRTSWWALAGALDELGDDYSLDDASANLMVTAKSEVTDTAGEIVEIALDVVGGQSYFTSSPLERAFRDVRAGKYHPMPSEKALLYGGRLALGEPAEDIW